VALLVFYSVLLLASGEEALVMWTGVPVGDIRVTLRVLVIVLPIITGLLAARIARGRLPAKGVVEEEEERSTVRELSESPIWLSAKSRKQQVDPEEAAAEIQEEQAAEK
jgi:hypothetical protein